MFVFHISTIWPQQSIFFFCLHSCQPIILFCERITFLNKCQENIFVNVMCIQNVCTATLKEILVSAPTMLDTFTL